MTASVMVTVVAEDDPAFFPVGDPHYRSAEAQAIYLRLCEARAAGVDRSALLDIADEMVEQDSIDHAAWAARVPITPCPFDWCDQFGDHPWEPAAMDSGSYHRWHVTTSPIDGVTARCWEEYGEDVPEPTVVDVYLETSDSEPPGLTPARARELAAELLRLADLVESDYVV